MQRPLPGVHLERVQAAEGHPQAREGAQRHRQAHHERHRVAEGVVDGARGELACTKSKFDTALKKLQVSLNIVRSNDPKLKNDFWLPMREVHLDIVQGN